MILKVGDFWDDEPDVRQCVQSPKVSTTPEVRRNVLHEREAKEYGCYKWQVAPVVFSAPEELLPPSDLDIPNDWYPANSPEGAWKLTSVSGHIGWWQRLLIR